MACKHICCPATHAELASKTQELLRLLAAQEYRFASRLAGILEEELAVLATAVGQPDEPVRDELLGSQIRVCANSVLP
jgi:hypothetical protein